MSITEPGNQLNPVEVWPSLPYEDWKDTYATLHLWAQIVGRIRGALSPKLNHWWHNTLYVTPRGLTTSPIPYKTRTFELTFDLIAHQLAIQTSDGMTRLLALYPRPVADFYRELMSSLEALGIEAQIDLLPHKPMEPIPYDRDQLHSSYDPEPVERFRRILVGCDRIFKQFRARYVGKCSPVQLWPGSFDLAVTRFSGRRLSAADDDASFESSSAGFWPGSGSLLEPAFYAYTTPAPEGIKSAALLPAGATFDQNLGEFILRYEEVRSAPQPEQALLDFLQSTYQAGAELGKWDRAHLEAAPVKP
jgi:Family of unknown function (DUF5996)